MMKKQSIPEKIATDPLLGRKARQLGLWLYERNTHAVCEENTVICNALHISERTLQRAFAELIHAGYGDRFGGRMGATWRENMPATWYWGKRRATSRNVPIPIEKCHICRRLLGLAT